MYNFWQVRLAIKLRSHDGINWEMDPGVAYTENAETYTDGTVVKWYKAERPKVVQDKHGRATHIALAMIDVIKKEDKCNDNHSSKHITLPILPEGLTEILNKEIIGAKTGEVRIKLIAEKGFDPIKDVDFKSLKFGDPKEVNYGKGVAATGSKKDGKDLIVTFNGEGFGITENSFTGKIIGKRTDGSIYYAYPRLPGFIDNPAALVLLPLVQKVDGNQVIMLVRVKNYGLETSGKATLKILDENNQISELKIKPLKPYEQQDIEVKIDKKYMKNNLSSFKGSFFPKYQLKK